MYVYRYRYRYGVSVGAREVGIFCYDHGSSTLNFASPLFLKCATCSLNLV